MFNFLKSDRTKQLASCTRQLLRAVDEKNLNVLTLLLAHWSEKLGTETVSEIMLDKVLQQTEEAAWLLSQIPLTEELVDEARLAMAQILTQFGMVPGKDFSFSHNGFYISERAKQSLIENAPEKVKDKIRKNLEAEPKIKLSPNDFFEAMHKRLGVPFYEVIAQVARERIAASPDTSNHWIAGYLAQLISGMIERNPEILQIDYPGHFLGYALQDLSSDRGSLIFQIMKAGNFENTQDGLHFADLKKALGLPAAEIEIEGEVQMFLSEDDLRAIDLVWQGKERLIDIALALENFRKGLK